MRPLGPLAVSLLAFVVGACSSSSGGAGGGSDKCRQVGTENGVAIYFEPRTLPSSGDVAVTACVDDACRTHVAKASEPNIFVPVLPTPPNAAVEVRVRVLSGSGDELFDGATSTHSIEVELHEHGCSASAARVMVIARKDGRLTPTP